jgi:acetyl/propionyl-CoA carboxylase alpha subunit
MNSEYQIHLSEKRSHTVSVGDDGSFMLDGHAVELDAVRTGGDSWNILHHHRSYNVKLVRYDDNGKKLTLSINDEVVDLRLTTPLDDLLGKMGMNAEATLRMVDVRAPMPGLVLKVLVEPGSEVSEGDPLIILEAMKMENVIKATGDGQVASILVRNQDAVEKNQVLIEMQ